MSYGLSTKAVGAPIGAGLRNRLAKPVKYIPLSQFFAQTGDEMEKYGIVGYADREEWGMLDPKEAKRGSKPVKAERETTKDPQRMKGVKKRPQKPPEDEPDSEEAEDGAEAADVAADEPEPKGDDEGSEGDGEEIGPEDDSGGTDDSGDEDADNDEEKPSKKKAKSDVEDEKDIDTEKNNPYLKHPFPPKEKSQEGALASGNMLAEDDWEDWTMESGGPLLPVKTGAVRSFTGATGTGNIATAAVPIGAGDGRKFLDSPRKRKRKHRRLSKQLYVLLVP